MGDIMHEIKYLLELTYMPNDQLFDLYNIYAKRTEIDLATDCGACKADERTELIYNLICREIDRRFQKSNNDLFNNCHNCGKEREE